ncbi:MAG: hypothetical protein ACYDH1_11255, partial [Anaerolineaceae bacterium]
MDASNRKGMGFIYSRISHLIKKYYFKKPQTRNLVFLPSSQGFGFDKTRIVTYVPSSDKKRWIMEKMRGTDERYRNKQ